jgi:hypothetical protein
VQIPWAAGLVLSDFRVKGFSHLVWGDFIYASLVLVRVGPLQQERGKIANLWNGRK